MNTASSTKRKRGIYIHVGSDAVFSGVDKKIQSQIKVFSLYYDMREVIIKKSPTNLLKSVCYRLPFGSFGREYDEALKQIKESGDIDFFYIRNQAWDLRWTLFIRSIRKMWPNSTILLEIPTYPYGKELLHNKTMWPWYFKDRIHKNKMSRYIDRIVTYSNDDSIMDIPTIKSMNGVDVEAIPLANWCGDDCDISIIAVAMMQPYHGYERLINGLADYYKSGGKLNYHIHFVGYGSELSMYQQLARDNKLENHIFFEGKLEGEALDLIYDKCDLAAGSMGGYKIGIRQFSSLKLGEYLAKGLPVITGARTKIFDEYGNDYNLDFPNDDSPIDFNKIAFFYKRIYENRHKEEIRQEIRDFALRTIDIKQALGDVIGYLKKAFEGLY